MKYTLYSLVFALTAMTGTTAFAKPAPPEEDPCALVDCADGLICKVETQKACGACTKPAPRDGEDVMPCEDTCTAQRVAVCIPPPPESCGADNDCSEGEVCVTYTFGTCGGSTGQQPCNADDEDCVKADPAPEPIPECKEETESLCVPKYAAPCEQASDCGPGFTCEVPEICECSAQAPVENCEAEDGTNCTEPDPMPCSCKPSGGDAYCKVIRVECDEDNACEDGFTCVSEPQLVEDKISKSDAKVACQEGTDCGDPAPRPSKSYCFPDGYEEWATHGGTSKVDGKKVESAERKGFFSNAGNGNGSKAKAEGCQVAHSPSGLAGSALLLLGFMFGFRRKRN